MSWCDNCNIDAKGCTCHYEKAFPKPNKLDATTLSDEELRKELEKRVHQKLIQKQNDLVNAPIKEEIDRMTKNFEKQISKLKKRLR